MKFVTLLVIWMVIGMLAQFVIGLWTYIRQYSIERENGIKFDEPLEVLHEVKDEDSEIWRFNPFSKKLNNGLFWIVIANLFGYLTWPVYAVLMWRDYMRAVEKHAIRKINEKLANERLGS